MYVSSLPGVAIAFASMPGRVRDLAMDLETLRETHRARLLVTLVEPYELEKYGVADLGARARAMGLDWVHAPIPDFGVPPSVAATAALVRRIVAFVGGDGEPGAVIHCRGGLGRSGTLAACCLVARGETAERAIQMVRVARAGAVENARQEAFVHAFRVYFSDDSR